jgi:hypothetical protein
MPESFEKLTDEQKADVLVKVAKMQGVPDTVDGYELTRPKLPEGMNYDEEGEKLIKDLALSHNFPQAVTQNLYNLYNSLMLKRHEANIKAAQEAAEKAVNQLEVDWGGTPKAKENFELNKRLLMHFGGDTDEEQQAMIDCLDMTHLVDTKDGKARISLGNMVPLLKALNKMAVRLVKEGVTIKGTVAESEVVETEQSLRKRRFPKSPQMDKTE